MTLKTKSLKSQQIWAFTYDARSIVSFSDSAIIHKRMRSPVISPGGIVIGIPTLFLKIVFFNKNSLNCLSSSVKVLNKVSPGEFLASSERQVFLISSLSVRYGHDLFCLQGKIYFPMCSLWVGLLSQCSKWEKQQKISLMFFCFSTISDLHRWRLFLLYFC